jgi:hypothetical protein
MSLHNAIAMIRSCVPARLAYWLRTVSPLYTAETAVALDKEIYRACAGMLNFPLLDDEHPATATAALQAYNRFYLPLSRGGAGFANAEDTAKPAWMASIINAGVRIASFTRTLTNIQETQANGSPFGLQALVGAFNGLAGLFSEFQEQLVDEENTALYPSVEHIFTMGGAPKVQEYFMQPFHAARHEHVFSALGGDLATGQLPKTFESAIFAGAQGTYGSGWQHATYNPLSDACFTERMRIAVGLPMFSPRDATTSFKCTCGETVLGQDATRHAMVCHRISMIGRHDHVRDAMFGVLKSIKKHVDGTTLAINVYKEPLLRDLVHSGLNGADTYWPRANPNSTDGLERRGDIHVAFQSRPNGDNTALLMDFVLTAPLRRGDQVGDAAKKATAVKYEKYRKVWNIPEGDKVFCPYAIEPTGFVHGAADLQLLDFLRQVCDMPPRTEHNRDVPPPHEYVYFLTRIRTSVSLALARGVADKVYKQRKLFTRVPPAA